MKTSYIYYRHIENVNMPSRRDKKYFGKIMDISNFEPSQVLANIGWQERIISFTCSFLAYGGESRDILNLYSDRTGKNIRHHLLNAH